MRSLYVIMPVASDLAYASKREVLREVALKAGVEPFLPLEEHQSISLERMVERIRGALCVLADLSLERPSCYYELGVAEAVTTRINRIAEAGTRIHQTAHRDSVRFFASLESYRDLIAELLDGCSE